MGARAAGRSAWLVAPALLVAFLRSALGWPAPLLALALLRAGAAARIAGGARWPGDVMGGALAALAAPRSLHLLAGLFLVGLLSSAALRIAWLAGVLPTLGGSLAREADPAPRFARGVAWGFAPMLGTSLLGLALELAGQLYLWTAALAALLLALHPAPPLAAVVRAGLGAVVLLSALAAPPLASLAADAALARTALAGDPPARALLEALRRVALRPAAFVLAGMALGLAALVVLGSAKAMESAALGLVAGAPGLLTLGPRLMTTVIGAALAALFELWRLGTVAALACAERP